MPRVAEPEPVFPWEDWAVQLSKSPTKALLFGAEDFGEMTPRAFREKAQREFKHLGVRVSVRGEEVLVALA